mmetsp:Transcript_13440/g.31598  ORF Transcript_13440/g.31598 Transcript_13440/m.31598 type:complete len:337 (-) Transcript_13440:62-1072(-)
MAGWLWDYSVPDDVQQAAETAEEERMGKLLSKASIGDPCWDDPDFAMSEEALERRCDVTVELAKLGGKDDLNGLPLYRCVSGEEMPFKASPMSEDRSVARYLVRSHGDAALAAKAMMATLEWRRRVLPDTDVSTSYPAALLEEGRRFLRLGPNASGDLVFGINFLFGHFLDEASLLDCLRMCILGVEDAVEAADSCDHPKVVLVLFGGPPPVLFARVVAKFLQAHYPERLRRAVIYPVPSLWASIVQACLMFLQRQTRDKISIATDEAEAVDLANLTGSEQLPESWRGGLERVTEVHAVDTSLISGITMEYLNPFGDSPDATEELLVTEPWLSAAN